MNVRDDFIGSLADDIIPVLSEDLLSENLSIACGDNQDNLSNNSVLYALRINSYDSGGVHNFYSVVRPGAPGFELDWSAWGLAFEYWDEEPRILGLGHYRWTL